MEQEAHLLSRVLPFGIEGAELDEICRQLAGELGSRITVIALDGKVLGDSAESSVKMENHRGRPEVVDALKFGTGSAQRHSTTVGFDMFYRAFYQRGEKQERIVRIAIPLKDFDSVIHGMRRSLIAGLVLASVAGLLLAWWFSKYLSGRVQRLVEFSGKVAEGHSRKISFPPMNAMRSVCSNAT